MSAADPLPGAAPASAAAQAPVAGPLQVLFVTQYFPPETGAAPARAANFARALVRAGHSVRVVTGLPNHPSGVVQAEYAGRAGTREVVDGVEVVRAWLFATPRKTPLTRLWNFLTFAACALPAAFAGPRADVVLVTVPPPFAGLAGWLAACFHRAPLVVDCRDDWPRAAIAVGEMRKGMIAGMLQALSSFLYQRARRVVAVTPGMKRAFEDRGYDAGRLALVTNGADTDRFTPQAPAAGLAGVTVLYAGTIGLVHGVETLLDAAERLRDRDEIRFVFIGDGVMRAPLEARAGEAGLARVTFRSSVPPERLVEEIAAADICVATTLGGAFGGETIPVKMFDALACGRPLVAAVSGDAADVVERSGGGVVVPPGDAAALSAAISRLADDPAERLRLGAAGPGFVAREYSRRVTGERLCAILSDVHAQSRGRRVAPMPAAAYRVFRRAADLVTAAGLLVLLSPLLIVVAIAIRLDSPGPALFRQRRIGRGSAEFSILKFRTMRVGTPDLASHLVGPGSSRVTALGRILRRTSIDELPQLWNVLMGEMTLIGPRPALFNQDDLIALRQAAGVDALKPGVTGWAQVNGRDDIPLQRKVEFDRYYLERVSPRLDGWILLRTAAVLFSKRGVY